ncbi:possible Resolvase, N terminal domain [Prochlorococcus marinus str. MIT 9313]|uniref:Possible Resolvase, N terminal domain n=1 Tax=Prochlorococcus marinus (strain MIT 9313) TaxID=74547 RepID=Q7TV54_PROMM|nr:possible Resolvase, N terminal domain [Prochlorococcus marinus str. MIT 9313]
MYVKYPIIAILTPINPKKINNGFCIPAGADNCRPNTLSTSFLGISFSSLSVASKYGIPNLFFGGSKASVWSLLELALLSGSSMIIVLIMSQHYTIGLVARQSTHISMVFNTKMIIIYAEYLGISHYL